LPQADFHLLIVAESFGLAMLVLSGILNCGRKTIRGENFEQKPSIGTSVNYANS